MFTLGFPERNNLLDNCHCLKITPPQQQSRATPFHRGAGNGRERFSGPETAQWRLLQTEAHTSFCNHWTQKGQKVVQKDKKKLEMKKKREKVESPGLSYLLEINEKRFSCICSCNSSICVTLEESFKGWRCKGSVFYRLLRKDFLYPKAFVRYTVSGILVQSRFEKFHWIYWIFKFSSNLKKYL